jgi:mannose-6-phosphate isomerase
MELRKLTPAIHEKVWGSSKTLPWLPDPEDVKIGELWFSAPEVFPVLVKLLFTTEKLSVQVHPDDSYARAHGEIRGKTEMWHILRAEPDATIAFGLREPVSKERLEAAALTGEIVNLLDWVPARVGDTFFVPAGTIHAIGGGLAVCEVQQLSDVTYRLYDYQRKPTRDLHIYDSLAVARLTPQEGYRTSRRLGTPRQVLAECEYFRTERVDIQDSAECPSSDLSAIYIAIAGEGRIAGQDFRAGEAWLSPAGSPDFAIEAASASFVIASGRP